MNNPFFSMALKPINIRWIRTGSQLYWKKNMLGIVLQKVFHEYKYQANLSHVSKHTDADLPDVVRRITIT